MQVTVSNLNPSTEGGVILSQRFNDLKANLYSSHLGTDDVPYAARGMLSAKDLGGNQVQLRYYNGTTHIPIGTVDESAETFTPAGQADAVPPGTVVKTARSSAPDGWLLCYGQAVSRSTYSDLFDAIGTAWGAGDGSTTFNVPDMRGRFGAGLDNMGGSAANRLTSTVMSPNGNTLGAVGGSQTVTLTEDTTGAHDHDISANPTSPTGSGTVRVARSTSTGPGTVTVATAGGGQPHSNVPPTALFNYMIKA